MKKTGWKTFDFHLAKNENKPPPTTSISESKKRKLQSKDSFEVCSRYKTSSKKSTFNFNERLTPKLPSELAVHPKKLQEVEMWLKINILEKNKREARFLLVNGPTGSGEYTTLKVLCQDLGISVVEWINPLDQNHDEFSTRNSNQVTEFTEFLSNSRYPSLNIKSSKETVPNCASNKKLVIVNEFPNAIIRNPQEFFNLLEEISFRNISVAFTSTDSNVNSNDSLSQKLFPQEIRQKFNIANITFNPCAVTLIKQALKRAQSILSEYPDLFKTPTPSGINAIIATSGGDLRSATNQLYFATLIGGSDLPVDTKAKTVKRKRGSNTISVLKSESKVSSMMRDESLGLFHGLGRVLNAKRTEIGDSWRFSCDLDKLVTEFETRPTIFVNFLFENYLNYFGDLKDASEAVEALSLSQNFSLGRNERDNSQILGLWVAVMGIMISNRHKVTKWNQIRGLHKINKKSQENTSEMKKISATDLYYYNVIRNQRKNLSQSQPSDTATDLDDLMIIEDDD